MKHAFWGYFVVACGIVIVVILLLVQRMTSTSEEDFYLAREVMESSMIDAVDYGTYRTTGRLVMSEQKFVEVFIRRFAENVTNNKTYKLEFFDIYEEPPKASVRVRTSSGNTANIKDTSFDVTLDTLVSGILETIYGQAAEGDDETGGGGGGNNTTTVACPAGGNIEVTPTPSDGGDDDDGDGDGDGSGDALWSPYSWYYSVGYIQDIKETELKSHFFTFNYDISYDKLPLNLTTDIASNKITDCEIKSGKLYALSSNNDIQEYRKYKERYGEYYIGGAGNATSSNANNITFYIKQSEIFDATGECFLYNGSVRLNLSYSGTLNRKGYGIDVDPKASYVDKNGNAGVDRINVVYAGVKWQLRFKYKK